MSTSDALLAGAVPSASPAPSRSLQLWSLLLPLLKCAVCPACLSVLGGAVAGARLGILGDERLHGSLLLVALLGDVILLRAAWRHHGSRWPLLTCLVGGALALAGHVTYEAVEYAGFGLLMVAAVQNIVLLRRHRAEAGGCCAHR